MRKWENTIFPVLQHDAFNLFADRNIIAKCKLWYGRYAMLDRNLGRKRHQNLLVSIAKTDISYNTVRNWVFKESIANPWFNRCPAEHELNTMTMSYDYHLTS